jgi:hypothetical protein
MKEHIEVFVFRDAAFAPSGDTLVCIAEKSATERFISKKEVSWAFSGCATYRRRLGRLMLVFGAGKTRQRSGDFFESAERKLQSIKKRQRACDWPITALTTSGDVSAPCPVTS